MSNHLPFTIYHLPFHLPIFKFSNCKIRWKLEDRKMENHGFTLVELMIVVSIIAILIVIAIAIYRSQAAKAKDARRKTDMARIKVAIEEYEKDHNCYPAYVNCGIDASQPIYPYLNNVPCDPETHASYPYEVPTGLSCSSWYRLYTKLSYSQDPGALPFCGGPLNNSYNYYTSSPNAPTCPPAGGSSSSPSSSTPSPSGGGVTGFWGCFSGVCKPIRNGQCTLQFQAAGCYGACIGPDGLPNDECITP